MKTPLRIYLDDNNISVANFALSIGVSRQTAYDYCKGKKYPGREVMQKIVDFTNGAIDANELQKITLPGAAGEYRRRGNPQKSHSQGKN